MVPFWLASVEEILRVLIRAILKRYVLEEAAKVDIAKFSNQLDVDQVKLGTTLKESFNGM